MIGSGGKLQGNMCLLPFANFRWKTCPEELTYDVDESDGQIETEVGSGDSEPFASSGFQFRESLNRFERMDSVRFRDRLYRLRKMKTVAGRGEVCLLIGIALYLTRDDWAERRHLNGHYRSEC